MSTERKDSHGGGFLWGAATSSHQVEGYNENNDWWHWESQGFIEGGVRSGAATDHLNRFREDLGLAAELGLNSYRFSIEWSRCEPEEGRWDEAAFDWYRQLLDECERLGLVPMLTLHHFTSPLWFAQDGGFSSPKSPERFMRFTREVIRRFGARVPLWCTFNEPMVLVVGGYFAKMMPPAEHSPEKASMALHHILKAHVQAYDAIHQEIKDRVGPWKATPLSVGIAHNMLDFMPDRAWHPIENVVAGLFRRLYNRAWLDAITGRKQHFGAAGLMPYAPVVKEALGRRTADYIGVNYYTKAYIQWNPKDAPGTYKFGDAPIGIAFARTKEPRSDLGWAIHPSGLGRILRFVSRYDLPIYITENGIADHDDDLRPTYLALHLKEVARAIRKGVDVRGYFHWSLLDNFEWVKGFGPRFGLYRVDYSTFQRTATQSAEFIKNVIHRHRKSNKSHPHEDHI